MISLLENQLQRRQKQGNLRQLHCVKNLIDFASNDYLGLARSPDLAFSIKQEWAKYNSFGSTGSRLLTGNSEYVQDLEDKIAHFHGFEAGLIFNCGYMANVGLISSIAGPEDTIFFDTHVHASIHDGMRLGRALLVPFRHNDLISLEARLRNHSKGKCFICVESLYSTDGSKAPLSEIYALSKLYNALLVVDEAHAIGVWGPQGKGLVAQNGLEGQIFAQIVTFGKALGAHGAIVLGNLMLKQGLINFARSFIYSTALPFPVLAAIKCSYDLFPRLEKERSHIKYLIKKFQNIILDASETQIQGVKIKGNAAVKLAAKNLACEGFDVRPLMSPTVRRGHEILRICLHACNTAEQVTTLLEHVKKDQD